jgi:hypothetical protein
MVTVPKERRQSIFGVLSQDYFLNTLTGLVMIVELGMRIASRVVLAHVDLGDETLEASDGDMVVGPKRPVVQE